MRVLAIILLLTVPALAQQPRQLSPSQMALQINSAVATMAQTLEAAEERIRVLEAENDQLRRANVKK